jgi:hypothetical protein
VDSASEYALNYFIDSFGSNYTVVDVPAFVSDSAQADSESFMDMAKSTLGSIQGAVESSVSEGFTTLDTIKEGIPDNLDAPCSMADNIVQAMNSFLRTVNLYGDTIVGAILGDCSSEVRSLGVDVDADVLPERLGISSTNALMHIAGNAFGEASGEGIYTSVYGGTFVPITVNTATRARQAANRLLLVNLARNAAIVTAVRIAIRIDYSCYETMVEVMDLITDAIDAQLLKLGNEAASEPYSRYNVHVGDSDSYAALENLRRDFVQSMVALGATLAHTLDYNVPPDGENVLSLAYARYGDVDRASELYERNRLSEVDHPGFLPGNETVKVLSE